MGSTKPRAPVLARLTQLKICNLLWTSYCSRFQFGRDSEVRSQNSVEKITWDWDQPPINISQSRFSDEEILLFSRGMELLIYKTR
jgi:hypothetical protein